MTALCNMTREARSKAGRKSGAVRNKARRKAKRIIPGVTIARSIRAGFTVGIKEIDPRTKEIVMESNTRYTPARFFEVFEIV